MIKSVREQDLNEDDHHNIINEQQAKPQDIKDDQAFDDPGTYTYKTSWCLKL